MINFTLKRAIAVAMLAGASVGANAASTSLGTVNFGAPTPFHGTIDPGVATFNDIFNFNPATPNFGTGATVVNIPLTVPGVGGGLTWNTILSTMTLMSSGADGVQGTGDDAKLVSATAGAGESLNVTGITNGTQGGQYSGLIGISPVPEPESFAMLLAGLGLMGAVVRRRSKHKG